MSGRKLEKKSSHRGLHEVSKEDADSLTDCEHEFSELAYESSIRSVNTPSSSVSSSISSPRKKALPSLPYPSNTKIWHEKLQEKHTNLSNILDCLSDMAVQESSKLESEIQSCLNDIDVVQNTYSVPLFNPKQQRNLRGKDL